MFSEQERNALDLFNKPNKRQFGQLFGQFMNGGEQTDNDWKRAMDYELPTYGQLN